MENFIFKFIMTTILTFSTSFASEYGYTVAVDAGQTECFFQTITDENAASVEIDYQVNVIYHIDYS